MKKLLVAASVLLLAGIAAAGAVHVKRSFEAGVCPLTGRPIHHHAMQPSAGSDASALTSPASDGTSAAAADAAVTNDDASTICPQTHRRCCCPSRAQCETKPVEQPTPPAPPAQNP